VEGGGGGWGGALPIRLIAEKCLYEVFPLFWFEGFKILTYFMYVLFRCRLHSVLWPYEY
jgi:hypothetical protein